MTETLIYAPWPIPETAWLTAWDFLQPAADRAGEGVVESDVAAQLDHKLAQLWLAYRDGEMVAACVTCRQGNNLHFWLCGGSKCRWRVLGELIMECAAMDGCTSFTFGGRRGWLKYLPTAVCED